MAYRTLTGIACFYERQPSSKWHYYFKDLRKKARGQFEICPKLHLLRNEVYQAASLLPKAYFSQSLFIDSKYKKASTPTLDLEQAMCPDSAHESCTDKLSGVCCESVHISFQTFIHAFMWANIRRTCIYLFIQGFFALVEIWENKISVSDQQCVNVQ